MRPDPVPSLDPAGEYLTRVWRDSVYPLAERLGMTMRLPPLQPRSRRAHEAAKWAQTQNQLRGYQNRFRADDPFGAYNEAVFRAFFERGEDISDIKVLVKLARDLNLDDTSLHAALDSKQFEPDVLADEREAAELGVHAVPAFIANRRFALSGVQSVTALEQLVNRASASEPRADG